MKFRKEVIPFLIATDIVSLLIGIIYFLFSSNLLLSVIVACSLSIITNLYLLYFFRDPDRYPPADDNIVVAGADGKIMQIKNVFEPDHLNTKCIRISIFLSPFDVHVNRSPISGTVKWLSYYPGRRFFTFLDKASEYNQHSRIVIENHKIKCLIKQICGPICRRVVFWLTIGQKIPIGFPIGMMKFGSRMDIFLPENNVSVVVKKSDKVKAGETIIARIKI